MGPTTSGTSGFYSSLDAPITHELEGEELGFLQFPEVQTTLEIKWKDKSYLMDIKRSPDPNCSKSGCYGRGYTGFNIVTQKPVMCKCTQK